MKRRRRSESTQSMRAERLYRIWLERELGRITTAYAWELVEKVEVETRNTRPVGRSRSTVVVPFRGRGLRVAAR